MSNLCVQFGCGTCAPPGWMNFDAGPVFWVEKSFPFLKPMLCRKGFPDYPIDNIRYADVVKGLPLKPASVDCVYCSHVLEHLTLEGFQIAVRNVFTYLRPGGCFRIVLPDLEQLIADYQHDDGREAAMFFMEKSKLGEKTESRGMMPILRMFLGKSHHLWMWDYKAISPELEAAGFVNVRRAQFNDSRDERFKEVESSGRWENSLGVECSRP